MKKFTIFIMCALISIIVRAQSFERNGNTFSAPKTEKSVKPSKATQTKFTYKDTDGKEYPIFVGKTGSCYIIRISKAGKEYKKYLGAEISAQVCKELGIKYESKSK